ncbi:hypothetical protein F5Y18DRAFT_122145 [Xylariaceae sp. FL1019]|nr:hypothetical protein F5Y18DRAFT_122145 [Xylariaceae sp. FL1019]
MSVALTYGSVGDIVTTIQLVYRLSQALSEAHGAARQLEDLVFELRLLRATLEQIKVTWSSRESCPELDRLSMILRPTIADSRADIEKFLEKAVRKYGKRILRPKGSRNSPWDIVRMIQWDLCESEKIDKLRLKLSRRQEIVQMVKLEANRIAEEQNLSALRESITALAEVEAQAEANLAERFAKLMEELEEQATTLSRIETVVTSSNVTVHAIEAKMSNIEQGIQLLSIPRRIDPSYENVVYIEDALGWILKVPVDIRPSWETVHSMIRDQFMHNRSSGLELVTSRRYVFQDRRTARDILQACKSEKQASQRLEFWQAVRPGQSIDMAMIFPDGTKNQDMDNTDGDIRQSSCPACRRVYVVEGPEVDVICGNPQCGLIFRRVMDVTDFDENQLEQRPVAEIKENEAGVEEGEEGLQRLIHSNTQGDLGAHYIDGLQVFKRVRLLSRWEDQLDSRGRQFFHIGEVCFWDLSSDHAVAVSAFFQMAVAIITQLIISPIHKQDQVIIMYCFGGRTLASSIPSIFVLSKVREARQGVARSIRRLEWVRKNSRFAVMHLPATDLGFSDEISKYARPRDMKIRDIKIREEAERRAERILGTNIIKY